MRPTELVSIGLCWMAALVTSPARPATPTPSAKEGSAALAGLPWGTWFEKNTFVTDKKAYVHILWDAVSVRRQLEGKEKLAMIHEAGRQLVLLRYPGGATADQIRVDIVFVTKRDGYGNPRWDSIQRMAHLEFSRRKLLESTPAGGEPTRGYEKFEVFQ
jgi:hypothetical protein